MPTLTKRQCSILWGLAAALTFEQIAKRLKMSPATVAGHRRTIGMILGVDGGNIVALLRAAVADEQIPADVLGMSVQSILKKVV